MYSDFVQISKILSLFHILNIIFKILMKNENQLEVFKSFLIQFVISCKKRKKEPIKSQNKICYIYIF